MLPECHEIVIEMQLARQIIRESRACSTATVAVAQALHAEISRVLSIPTALSLRPLSGTCACGAWPGWSATGAEAADGLCESALKLCELGKLVYWQDHILSLNFQISP